MAQLSVRERAILVGVSALYAAAMVPIGIHKGGDLAAELGQAERMLRGAPLFTDASAVTGVPWPPFATLALVPLALVARWSVTLAKASFTVLSVGCLGWSVARARAARWGPVVPALAAVAVPLQTNFEDLNLNAPLLALLVLAVHDLERGRETRAGLTIGVMTALKAFPVVLLLYLAYRRHWRGLLAALGATAGLTAAALLPFGISGGAANLRDWIGAASAGGFRHLGSNQSLEALVVRLGAPPAFAIPAALACLAAVGLALRRKGEGEGEGAERDVPYEIGIAALVAVLLSPIAHTHYYLLAFPAWLAVLRRAGAAPFPARRAWYGVLAVAGVATSGILTVGSYRVRHALFELAPYTWGALILLAALLLLRAPGSPARPPAA